ncbi:MAG: hypothetical protein LBJ62_00640 [Bifidobacteriaceae bacterium]|nr:hypothetical protein [Bifidobacteriaceae bacterium]
MVVPETMALPETVSLADVWLADLPAPGVSLAELIGLVEPVGLSNWWLVGGIILLASGLIFGLVRWLAKHRPELTERPDGSETAARLGEPLNPGQVAAEQINAIEAAWQAGRMTDRAAAQSIAAVIKRFAGVETAAMTLLDFKIRDDLRHLAEVIELAYPVEFGVKGKGDVAALAVRARQAVTQ